MKKVFIALTMMVLILAAFAMPAQALSLYGDTIYYDTGIYASGGWANSNTYLNWDITDNMDGTWLYEYTWHTSTKGLSHIIIEVTENAPLEDFWFFSTEPSDDSPKTWTSQQGNPEMPFNTYGFKIEPGVETTNFIFSFESNHSPTWGDFYAKDGTGVYAYNQGFSAGGAGSGNDDGLHIAVPNGGGTPVPEPSSLILLFSGFSSLALYGKRRFLKKM